MGGSGVTGAARWLETVAGGHVGDAQREEEGSGGDEDEVEHGGLREAGVERKSRDSGSIQEAVNGGGPSAGGSVR
jgi:hypothetical protein